MTYWPPRANSTTLCPPCRAPRIAGPHCPTTGPWSGRHGRRRGLQRIYLEATIAKLNATPSATPRISSSAQTGQVYTAAARPSTDVKALLRQELRTLDAALAAASAKAADAVTRAHIADARFQIKQALEPK